MDEAEVTASLMSDGMLQLASCERLPGTQTQNLDAPTRSQLHLLILLHLLHLTVGSSESGGWGHIVFINISPEADPRRSFGATCSRTHLSKEPQRSCQ